MSADLSVPVLLSWNTAAPGHAAVEWGEGAIRLRHAAEHAGASVTRLNHTELSGTIRDAAEETASRLSDSLGSDSHRLSIISTALEDGESRLTSAVSDLQGCVELAERTGFTVLPDGTCTPSRSLIFAYRALSLAMPTGVSGFGAAMAVAMVHTRRVREFMELVLAADVMTAQSLTRAHPGGLGQGPTSIAGAAPDLDWFAGSTGGTVMESGPEHGNAAVIGYGADLDDAEHVIILVPGTGSDLTDRDSVISQATKAHGMLTGATVPTTVLVAMHDAPGNITAAAGNGYHPTAAEQVRTVAARAAESATGAKISVAGFSHGAVVAAQAARGPGVRADSVVLIGSPGTGPGLRSASEMTLIDASGKPHSTSSTEGSHSRSGRGHGRVLVARDPADIVTHSPLLGVHGADPAAEDFGAELIDLPDSGRRIPGVEAHEGYFTNEQSMRSITKALESAVGK